MPKPEKGPIIIGVMGMTGTGKSTFINKLTNDPDIAIGTGLRSCTKEIQSSTMYYKSHEVILVDTPGFDDTARDDADVLYELAAWLKGLLQNEKKLAGLIYLHRITDNRLGSSAVRNLRMMRELVGDNNMKNVVLVTTRWENLASKETGEEVLQNDLLGPGPPPGFWYDMVTQGASHAMHDGSEQSAKEIVGLVVERSPVYLQIQEELRAGTAFSKTGAAQALIKELQQRVEQLQKTVEEVTAKLEQVDEQNAELKTELSHNRDLLDKFKEEVDRLMSNNGDEINNRMARLKSGLRSRSKSGKLKCVLM